MKNLAILFTLVALSSTTFAIDSSKCPEKLSMGAEVTRVFQTSKYSNVEGWQEAQKSLQANSRFTSRFTLYSRGKNRCTYLSLNGHTATLMTSRFVDPEDNSSIGIPQLIVNLHFAGSDYVTFVPVKSYDRNNLELFGPNSTSLQKIKVKLQFPQGPANIDLGMINVKAQAN